MKNKKVFWGTITDLAIEYTEAENDFTKEVLFSDIIQELEAYVAVSSRNAVKRAELKKVTIPYADFESQFKEAVWSIVESFDPKKGEFIGLLSYRFTIAEAHVWRKYRVKGDDDDKDGYSYSNARAIPLNLHGNEDDQDWEDIILGTSPSAEDELLGSPDDEAIEIIREFAKSNERYAKVILFLYQNYEGEELAEKLGFDNYGANLRKTVQRSKKSFSKFIEERKA